MGRKLVAAFVALCFCAEAFAVFGHSPLPASPKADEIGEIYFERSDTSEYVTMRREDFVRFFSDGIFQNKDVKSPYDSTRYAEPLSKTGEWQYCSGSFATTSGKVFAFNRSRLGVLHIEDSQYRSGWLVLPKSELREGSKSESSKVGG